MSFFEPQSEPRPRYRSGRLQEEQRLVVNRALPLGEPFFTGVPTLANINHQKSPHSPLKNSCSHATGTKKDGYGATRVGEPDAPPSRIVEIGLELIIVSGEWIVRWFPPAWKVRNSQQWWPQSLRRCPHPESVLLPS